MKPKRSPPWPGIRDSLGAAARLAGMQQRNRAFAVDLREDDSIRYLADGRADRSVGSAVGE